jgi:ABC-type Zn2+ transport system substrate-binding protein/surface adhesin
MQNLDNERWITNPFENWIDQYLNNQNNQVSEHSWGVLQKKNFNDLHDDDDDEHHDDHHDHDQFSIFINENY